MNLQPIIIKRTNFNQPNQPYVYVMFRYQEKEVLKQLRQEFPEYVFKVITRTKTKGFYGRGGEIIGQLKSKQNKESQSRKRRENHDEKNRLKT